jgi:hypothetical protein
VAILNRMTNGHLDDAALAEIWTGNLQSADPGSDPHLRQCAECRVRLAAFDSWMHDIRDEAVSEADEAFPAERLLAQQAQILRRLEAAERPARVIAFPNATTGVTSRRSSVARWVAAGVAAGVIAGVGIGQLMDLRHLGAPERFAAPVALNQPRAAEPKPASPVVLPASIAGNEETMLADLEAMSTPRYDTLRAYDEFTPHAADYVKSR